MANGTMAIEARGLRKSYKQVEVLRDVSFAVPEGSIFALLGANGAGKTTTINILTTLLQPEGGTASVGGFDVATDPKQVRARISLTGQFAAVDDVLTARENLNLIGELRHIHDPAATSARLLEEFDLAEAADRPVTTFSGGMRRRLDIAMSLIGDPAIIFFDEPTTGLDPQGRNAVWAKIRQLAASGTTILLTTQYLDEADELADQVAVLVGGTIRASGTPDELKRVLPHGQIELAFSDLDSLAAAETLLGAYPSVRDDPNLSLTLTTDGSIDAIASVAGSVRAAGLDVSSFTQKTPTLDEAFLKIIDDSKDTPA